ncbi:MAG: CsbD family protein [Nocardioidaceae bacterium]
MGNGDKARHKAQEATGKAKKAAGKATDNDKLEGRGKREKKKANVKQAGQKAKDALKS